MKKIIIILTLTFIMFSPILNVSAAYNYGPLDEVASAESIVVSKVIDSSNLVNTLKERPNYKFGDIMDVTTFNNQIYIVDSSNNNVVVLNENYEFVRTFPNSDILKKPKGIFVTNEYIYICDYGNNRVAIFNHSYDLVKIVSTPDDTAFKDYEFRPKKITVTRTGRMYVIAEGINEGIIDFNPDGSFSRYHGMNSVTVSGWDAFWLLFTSEKQRAQQGYNFGASLTNLCIDKDEYIYTVSSSNASGNFIKKLNFKGSDVLTRNGFNPQNGDVIKTNLDPNVPDGASSFVDIDVNSVGTYIALDKTRGRIFAYDFEGNLLYVGGMLGNVTNSVQAMKGTFQIPEALCYFKDNILVVDSKNKNLVVFEFTEFGKLINSATELYYQNDYQQAKLKWEEVLNLNTNYFLAYSGIGKANLRVGNYKEAMKNLKLGYDSYNYSIAYEQYRYEKISKVFPFIIGVILISIIALLVKIAINNAKRETKEKEGK